MPKRILVVEADVATRHLIDSILNEAGYEVATPVDTYAALELALDNGYDLIVLGVRMPLMDGEDFIRAAREEKVLTPALLLYDAIRDAEPSISKNLGVVGAVPKPFRVDHLLERIERALQ
jgi:DNA-binding response OmpR family regulator